MCSVLRKTLLLGLLLATVASGQVSRRTVRTDAYGSAWNGDTRRAPSADAVYDAIGAYIPLDPNLSGIAALDPNTGGVPYKVTGGADVFSSFPTTAYTRAMMAEADMANLLGYLGVGGPMLAAWDDATNAAVATTLGYDTWVNAKWYAEGDGTTDDSADLDTALAAVPRGGVLLVPAGDYLIDEWVIPTTVDDVTIQGVGIDTRFVSKSSDDHSINIKFGASNIRFADCFIDGNNVATSIMAAGSYVMFDRCKIDGHTDQQVHLVSNKGTLRDCLVTNTNATDCNQLVLAEYNDWTIDHVQFEGQDGCHCLTVEDVNSLSTQMFKGHVTNCQFEGWEDTAHYAIYLPDDLDGVTIDNSYFEGTGGTTIYVADGVQCHGLMIRDNHFSTCNYAVHLDDPSYYGTISIIGNTTMREFAVDLQSTRDANDLCYLPILNIYGNAWHSGTRSEFIEINSRWMLDEIRTTPRTASTFGPRQMRLSGFDLDTSDATETSLYELYVRDSGGSSSPAGAVLRAEIYAFDDWAGGDDVSWFESTALVINKASAEIVEESDTELGNADTTGWLCSWDVTGDLTRLRVTGQAGTDVHWTGEIFIDFKGI